MAFTEQTILDSHAKHSLKNNDPVAIFYAVCLDVLGYTPLGHIIHDMTEYNAFEEAYQRLIG